MRHKLLYIAATPIEADLIATFLESQSIRITLEHYQMASVLPVGGDLSIKILVHEAQWERALELLKTYVQQEKEDN
ncbi:MAG: DUF2007 domain-containing protein [Schleiferiaceae bacterium]|jgi:hypothetical protein|nr:DUF2007 domain-containing protein [Schleiferiaceae bacterium]